MHKLKYLFLLLIVFFSINTKAQYGYWQQHVDYKMDIDFNVKKNTFKGDQILKYTNNSPDVLDKIYYHLYFNAFQPGSMMDERNKFLPDSDDRVKGRISALKDDEIGYLKVKSLLQNGIKCKISHQGTILEVVLNKPIKPNETIELTMDFKGQVPLQIRRSGRDNKENIEYSMSQWYPKLSEYDFKGWHANPYVGREFHGVWGDFDVKIKIDSKYILGGTGEVKNGNEVGYGYEDNGFTVPKRKKKQTWHFVAKNVHDFVWAADPDYKHTTLMSDTGTLLHFLYQEGEDTKEWENLPAILNETLTFLNKNFGKYPYPVYSFIQGGDGGMEYPMATLIRGNRNLESLVGVCVHEWLHSWYQMMLATDEALYPWMDEGFTSYATSLTEAYLGKKGLIKYDWQHPFGSAHRNYYYVVKAGIEEPLTTHSDHYSTNTAYGIAAYSKGLIFCNQLEYVIGEKTFRKALLTYFDLWKFKHPTPDIFMRILEKESGLELDWYQEYWVNSTKSIDYAIEGAKKEGRKTVVSLKRIGEMPMPIDLVITTEDGKKHYFNIPLRIMRGNKVNDIHNFETLEDWPWTNMTYEAVIPLKYKKIKSIQIDESARMTDINLENNVFKVK